MGKGPPDYVKRINRATDCIVRDLARPLPLEDVAVAAGLSPCHFHRIFKAMLGETPHQFAKRLRLQRAIYMMSHAPARTLTDVALRCGFSSSSDFSRSFRQQYGVAPREFDLDAYRQAGRERVEQVVAEQVGASLAASPCGDNPDGFQVLVRDVPARTVAYIRVADPYRAGVVRATCDRLLHWALARGLADGEWLGYMWDEPEIAGTTACRYDVALVVDHVEPDHEIGCYTFPPMRIAALTVRGDLAMEARAIDWLYKTWLPRSGYVPDDQPMFESWIGRPFAHGNEYLEIVCQLPVTPAGP